MAIAKIQRITIRKIVFYSLNNTHQGFRLTLEAFFLNYGAFNLVNQIIIPFLNTLNKPFSFFQNGFKLVTFTAKRLISNEEPGLPKNIAHPSDRFTGLLLSPKIHEHRGKIIRNW